MLHPRLENIEDAGVPSLNSIMPKRHGCATKAVLGAFQTRRQAPEMNQTYKAVQVTKPGRLELVERATIEPAPGQVRIRVEACGVCHTDALTVEGGFPGLTYPRVPGHEVIGKNRSHWTRRARLAHRTTGGRGLYGWLLWALR